MKSILISDKYEKWKTICDNRQKKMDENQKIINRRVMELYGIEDVTVDISDQSNTLHSANIEKDIKSLISYAIGCMFGRYSLDCDGIIFAGGIWNPEKYMSFLPDKDNIIPITDEEYFSDDVVGKFCEWLKVVYGDTTLEQNLDFIASVINVKGNTSREKIRNYFIKDFISDHMKIYQKTPIYWLFDAGKENGFKALIYMHRYTPDIVGIVRTEYLHKTQKAIEQAMQRAEYISENAVNSTDKKKAMQQINKYTKQLAQMKSYDEAMAHIANQRIEIDLDDGVKVNYEKFQGVEVAQEGKKALKIDLLAKIK